MTVAPEKKNHVFVFCFVLADVKYVEGTVLNLIGGNIAVPKRCKNDREKGDGQTG